jgi:hypothetical protein
MAPDAVERLVPSSDGDWHERHAAPACLEVRATLVIVATHDGESEDLEQWNHDTVGDCANA